MSAEDEIRRTLARYIHSHDRNDPDGVMATFADGARLLVPSGARPVGRAAIRAFMEEQYTRRRATRRRMKHLYANSDIDVRGPAATVISDWVAYESVDGGPWAINMIGQSIDQFVLENDQWLIAERHNIDSRTAPEAETVA